MFYKSNFEGGGEMFGLSRRLGLLSEIFRYKEIRLVAIQTPPLGKKFSSLS